MIERPTFKPSFYVQVIEPEGALLLSERGHVALPGLVYARLASLLDGRRTADEIVDLLADAVSAPEVYFALGQLEAKGYITAAADGSVPPERAAFWATLDLDAAEVGSRMAAATVAVERFGDVCAEPLLEALASLGVRTGEPADVTVAVTEDYLHAGLADLNDAALAAGRPWLLVKPIGTVLWLGPF
ncbi:MAG: TOMM precursor leader peptide-binding protein, partial [Dehalococcoidia bacterium]